MLKKKFYFYIPNIITISRILCSMLFVYCFLYDNKYIAYLLYFYAISSDFLDGYLARKWKCETFFGAAIDPLADKLCIIGAYFCGSMMIIIPWWFTYLIFIKEIIQIIGGLIVICFFYDKFYDLKKIIKSSYVGKMLMICYSYHTSLFLSAYVFNFITNKYFAAMNKYLIIGIVILSLYSIYFYVRRVIRKRII